MMSPKKKIEQILQRESKRIFTIYEAKGLEFNYIICINLLSDCEQQWEEIMCNLGEGSSRHRFYFNVLYVALTRAREYIYSIEEKDTCQNLLEKILSTQIDTIDIVEIADFNAEEWLEEGKRFEKVDDYVRAISAYIKYRDLVGSFDQSNIIRCQAKQLRYRNKTIEGYNQAGVKFLSINMLEEARDAFRLGKNQMKVLEVEIRMGNKTQEVINSFRQYIKEGLTDEGFLETYIQHFVTTRIHDQKQNIQLIQAQIKELSKGV